MTASADARRASVRAGVPSPEIGKRARATGRHAVLRHRPGHARAAADALRRRGAELVVHGVSGRADQRALRGVRHRRRGGRRSRRAVGEAADFVGRALRGRRAAERRAGARALRDARRRRGIRHAALVGGRAPAKRPARDASIDRTGLRRHRRRSAVRRTSRRRAARGDEHQGDRHHRAAKLRALHGTSCAKPSRIDLSSASLARHVLRM
jgi:hypothetical protein